MKTLKTVPIQLVKVVDYIPESSEMEFGKFYYSERWMVGTHICACGCGTIYSVPIIKNGWTITDEQNLTITPSFSHTINCKAYYVIVNGKVNILREGLPKSMWCKSHGDDAQPGE